MNTKRANSLNGSDWLKYSFSIWRGLVKEKNIDHPAIFPVSLASRLIKCYVSNQNGIVLDPFAGSGSTLLAAVRAGIKTIGIDINPKYREIFQNRLSLFDNNNLWEYLIHDSRYLDNIVKRGSIDICITSPPYWNILDMARSVDRKKNVVYSNNDNDIGNIHDYNAYLEELKIVIKEIEKVLRPNGYFILNIMDIRKKSMFYPLHQSATNMATECGFILDDIIIWDRQNDYNSMRPLGYPYKFIINKVHEYLLIFQKKRPKYAKTSKS